LASSADGSSRSCAPHTTSAGTSAAAAIASGAFTSAHPAASQLSRRRLMDAAGRDFSSVSTADASWDTRDVSCPGSCHSGFSNEPPVWTTRRYWATL